MKAILILTRILLFSVFFWALACSSSTGSLPFKVTINDAWIDDYIDIDSDGYSSTAKINFEVSSNKNTTFVAAVYTRVSGNTQDPTYFLYKQTESFALDGTELFFVSLGNEGQELASGCYDFLIQIFLASNLDQVRAEISADNIGALAGICFEEHTQDQVVEIELENPLFTPMEITIINYETKTANPGEKISFLLNGNPGTINITAETYGKTNSGTQIGLKMVWDFDLDITGLSVISRKLSLSKDFFFIFITNNSSVTLTPLYVNYNTIDKTTDNIFFPNDNVRYTTGYYRAFSNTVVLAGIEGTTSGVFWYEETLNFIPWASNQSVDLLYSGNMTVAVFDKTFDKTQNELPPIYTMPIKRRLYKANHKIEPVFGKPKKYLLTD